MTAIVKEFKKNIRQKSADDVHRLKILKAITTHETKVAAMQDSQFGDWQPARDQAAAVKQYVLEHLPDLLELFEQKISGRGVKVLWAANSQEACSYVWKLHINTR